MKKVYVDPFSNGTEMMAFEERCCNNCVKHSRPYKNNKFGYTKITCAIERDIMIRMGCNEPINQRTIDVCRDFVLKGTLCPWMKTERKRYVKKDVREMFL